MIFSRVHLNQYYKLEYDPYIEISTIDRLDEEKRKPSKTIVIVPGGGYDFVLKREGDPVAVSFMVKGYITIVLHYSTRNSCKSVSFPTPQLELLAAMDFLLKHSDDYSIDVNNIFMVGFSAGGHLVGTYAYEANKIYKELFVSFNSLYIPKAITLSYPVITLVNNTHLPSRDNITNNNPLLYEELSIERNVNSEYPPTFVWTTAEDGLVDPISTTLMDKALTKNNVIHKTIVFPHGEHGLALANEFTSNDGKTYKDVSKWVDIADDFFKSITK